MAKYKCDFVKVTEGVSAKTGRPWKKYDAQLTAEDGTVIESASSFSEMQAGRDYEGTIIKNGNFTNFEMTPTPGVMGDRPAYVKGNGIKQAMDRKEQGIAKTMDRKENGMLLSGSSRDATSITIAQFTGRTFTTEEFQTQWKFWRTWLIDNHGDPEDITETTQPF